MNASPRFLLAVFTATFTMTASFACSGVDSDLLSASDDTTTGDAGGAGGDSGRVTRDAGKTDGSVASDSGTVQKDSGGPKPGVVPALCGSSLSCNSSEPTCCATQGDGTLTTTSYQCSGSPSECGGGGSQPLPILCHDDSDCSGGNVCCGELVAASAAGGYKSVSCESSCPAKDGTTLTTHVPFCASTSTPVSCSTLGLKCEASSILPGFIVCGSD